MQCKTISTENITMRFRLFISKDLRLIRFSIPGLDMPVAAAFSA
jgi:hypothetical protein